MMRNPSARAPKKGAPAPCAAAPQSLDDVPSTGEWTLYHGVRMTKRLKTHVLAAPNGEPAMYARTLDEVLFYLYDRGVMAFDVVEDRRLWQLRIVGPPSEPLIRRETDYG